MSAWEERQPHHGYLPGVYLLSPRHGWAPLLGLRSCTAPTCRLCCPSVTVHLAPQAGDWKRSLYTLFPSGPQQCPKYFSRCFCLPPTPTDGTACSSFRSTPQHNPAHDLTCSCVDRLAHLAVTHLLGLESSLTLALKKRQFRLQQKQEWHVKHRCTGKETIKHIEIRREL